MSGGALVLLLLLVLVARVFVVLRRKTRNAKHTSNAARTLVVLGSGGHTAEMLALLTSLRPASYSPMHFVVADTDTMSEGRARDQLLAPGKSWAACGATFHRIRRAREVRQSWLSSAFSTAVACMHALLIVGRSKPELVLVNGPGTCLPLCLCAVLLELLGYLGHVRIVFVESYCRVHSLSLTGKILHKLRLCDRFLVQWGGLAETIPRTAFIGRLM